MGAPKGSKNAKGNKGARGCQTNGRPKITLSPDYYELVYKLKLLGLSDEKIANIIGITVETFNRNKKDDKDFFEAYARGSEQADATVIASLYERAAGYKHKAVKILSHEGIHTDTVEYIEHYPPDPTSAIFLLKNKHPEKWRDKQDIEHSGKIETDAIDFSKLSVEDSDALIAILKKNESKT